MENLKRIRLAEDQECTVGCDSCNSAFRFKQSEGSVTYHQLDGRFTVVVCPFCSSKIFIDLYSFVRE